MALILNIETATLTCSVSLGKDGSSIANREVTREHYSHAEELGGFIQEVVEEGGGSFQKLDAIAVSSGPGSYTGLRIGVSTAKGLAYGLKIPLIGLGTLRSMAIALAEREKPEAGTCLVPVLDSRHSEIYCSVHDHKGSALKEEMALDLATRTIPGLEGAERVVFFGSGAEKAQEYLEGQKDGSSFSLEHPSAEDMAPLAEERSQEGRFEDLFKFEPFYLKDFVPTVPKGRK